MEPFLKVSSWGRTAFIRFEFVMKAFKRAQRFRATCVKVLSRASWSTYTLHEGPHDDSDPS